MLTNYVNNLFPNSGVWFDKIKKNSEKWVQGLGLPLVSRTIIVEDLQTLHIPTNKKLEVLDTIQATSFFPWWLLLFSQETFEAKGDL